MAGWCGVWWLAALCGCAAALQAGRLEAGRLWAAPHAFDVETTVFLNDVARADKEVGYKIRAALHVEPVWADGHTDFLLKFQLLSPKLYLRGKHVNADFMPYDSVWDSYTDSTFYAHWSHGLIEKAYLDSSELLDVTNYKKSLLSLFQFQGLDGKHNETDVSGACTVLYETMSELVFRKIKTECAGDGGGVVRSARRVARYTLLEGRAGLAELHAEELLALGQPALGLKARSWHRLQARAAPPAPPAPPARPPPHASLAGALRALGAALLEQALTLAPEDDEPAGEQELLAALQETDSRAALRGEGAGQGGGAAGAAGALRLLPLLRRTAPAKLLQLLQEEDMHDALPGLCRLLGLAGTRASHSAARDFLQLHTGDPLRDLAHTYLAAFALSDAPDEWAVLEVLRLGEEGRAPDVSESALLAAAAAAARLPEPGGVRDALARGLARCRDERCRALRLRALGNLRRAAPELLLEHAERGAGPAALAALDALLALPPRALRFVHLDRLGQLALNDSAPLELRAAALDLVTQRRAELPAPLARLAYALHSRGPHELRRVLWQRMAALAPIHEALRALPAMLEPELRGWDAQAHAGTSAVLTRATGWALGGWRGSLQSVQVARDGLLRRGSVQLLAEDANNHTFDALTVEVWTRGLQAFGGGGEGTEGAEDEEPAAGLALAVGGARMRDVSLFSGQAELLGHVWAGTASTPTAVLRALLPLAEERCSVPLLGGVRLRGSWRAALALALDASAQASLWRRSARAALRLRGGLAGEARAALRAGGGRLEARASLRAEPRLRVAADLDFYDTVALCVRVRTDEMRASRSVRLEAQQGARRLRVRRSRELRMRTEGRTLALGRPNDQSCRTLLEAGDDSDE